MLLLTIFFPSAAMPLSSAYISTARLKEGGGHTYGTPPRRAARLAVLP